jgi:hypothetical protein
VVAPATASHRRRPLAEDSAITDETVLAQIR